MDNRPPVGRRIRERAIQSGLVQPWQNARPPQKKPASVPEGSGKSTIPPEISRKPAYSAVPATMDPNVSSRAARMRGSVECDQVLFTSCRSATGEGYRIVAAGTGVRSEEKAEITRWSPSHGSLCNESDDAVGLLSYPLRTGRFVVSVVRYDGLEPSGRGGKRVWTHAVLLTRDQYQRFGFNPIRVHAALRKSSSELPPEAVGEWVGPAVLATGLRASLPPILETGDRVGRFIDVIAMLMLDGRWLADGVHHAMPTLEWSISAMPMSERLVLSLSVGIKPASTRPAKLVFVDEMDETSRRMTRGHGIRYHSSNSAALQPPPAFEPWFGLVRKWGAQGRLHEIDDLTSRILEAAGPAELTRLAMLCDDMDRMSMADADTRREILEKYQTFVAYGSVELDLFERITGRRETV